jgi:hypothetical protein
MIMAAQMGCPTRRCKHIAILPARPARPGAMPSARGGKGPAHQRAVRLGQGPLALGRRRRRVVGGRLRPTAAAALPGGPGGLLRRGFGPCCLGLALRRSLQPRAGGQSVGNTEAGFDLAERQHATIRGELPAVEAGDDGLAGDR